MPIYIQILQYFHKYISDIKFITNIEIYFFTV